MKIGKYEITISQSVLILIITVIVILTSVITFLTNSYNKSFQSNLVSAESENVISEIKIYENSMGISHIEAKNEKDMLFAIGYLHARDRLWQLEFNRRIMKGQLAELFGKQYIEIDLFFRTLDLDNNCKKIYNSLTPHEKYILKSYSKGINEYIKESHNKLPFEFGLFDITPQKWMPYHSILLQRLFALESSYGFWYEPILGEISQKIGVDKTRELMPNYGATAPIIFANEQNSKASDYIIPPDSMNTTDSTKPLASISGVLDRISKLLPLTPGTNGCNLWIARKDLKDSSSMPIMANDFHSSLNLPNKWYQLHYSCPSMNVTGFTLPGVPFAIAGRNDFCAWGYTTARVDDIDYFYHRIDSTKKYYYLDSGDTKYRIKLVVDTLKIAKSKPYIYFQKKIRNNFLLNGSIFSLGYINKPEKMRKLYNHYAMIYKWLGNEKSNEIEALYRLSIAKTQSDFKNSCNYWKVPGAVFGYCDISGNMALQLAAAIPLRKKSCNPIIPNKFIGNGNPWYGVKNLTNSITDPKNNFLFAANNKISNNDSTYITYYWDAPSRAKRIAELLFTTNLYNVSEAQIMQNDIYSSYANDILSICLPVWFQHKNLFNQNQLAAYTALKNWDCIYSTESFEASIFTIFIERLVYNTFKDELGTRMFNKFYLYPMLANNKIYDLLTNFPTSPWFDNVKTNNQESSYFLVFKSLMEGVNILTRRFGTSEIREWKYGLIRNMKPTNIMEESGAFTKVGSVDPVKIGGNAYTITNTYNQKKASFGASYRFIADLQDTVIYSIIPGGASADPISPTYSNQYKVWSNSGYLTLPVNKVPRDYFMLKVILKPKS